MDKGIYPVPYVSSYPCFLWIRPINLKFPREEDFPQYRRGETETVIETLALEC